jgi:hypothetical protein
VTEDSLILADRIRETLNQENRENHLFPANLTDSKSFSAVLFLLGEESCGNGSEFEPCLIFNKRSQRVKQAGDLCFPGGAIAPRLDPFLARLLKLPFSPLSRWPYWQEWRVQKKEESQALSLLLAAGLREGLEEMRLNPFGGIFLGPLPPQELHLLGKMLYPLVIWIKAQKRFHPNWEVEKVVSIPLKEFLNPENYISYRMHFASTRRAGDEAVQIFPGFLQKAEAEAEVLWGVTYRIVVTFLEIVFGFSPPGINELEVVDGYRGETYFQNGPFNS